MNEEFWKRYYGKHRHPGEPSPFARFVRGFLNDSGKTLIDVGCGNGRDSLYLGRFCKVIGVDKCGQEIRYLASRYRNVTFESMDIAQWPSRWKTDHVYARFFLHAIEEETEDHLLKTASDVMRKAGYLFLEFRTVRGRFKDPVKDRRFIAIPALQSKLMKLKFRVRYMVEDRGLAFTKAEDPWIGRIVAQQG